MKRARTVKTILSVLALFVAAGIQTAVAEISTTPGWYLDGTKQYEQVHYISSAGDVNGDGYEDIVVGANGRGILPGYASLFYGSSSGLSTIPAWTVVNDQANADFGHATGIGDVNGDGYADVLVGAPNYNNGRGRVYIYYGSTSGLSTTANLIIEGNQADALLGFRPMNNYGDLNKDGYDDVIISANRHNNDTGQVYIYYGSSTGLSNTPGWTVTGDQTGGSFGFGSCIAGDVNGDGWLDVIIGTGYYNNGLPNAGRVYVYYGSASGLSTTPSLIIEGKQAGGYFGDRVSPAGDVNGDGYDDITVGAYWYNNGVPQEGAAFIYYGSATGLNANNYSIVSTGIAGASVGWVNKVGDVNNDGYDDIITGSTNENGGQGKVRIYLGSATGLSTTPYWTAQSALPGAHYGFPCGSADVNGDGARDILVGAHLYPNSECKGRAYVYYGILCDAAYWKNAYERVKAELDDCRSVTTTTTTVPPTLIEMSYLSATPANQKVKLEWKTEAEIDNAGFNVWRAEGFTKISPALIPAQGSPTFGAEYDFVDDLVFNGKQYIYLIEDMDNGGISTFHGPVKAVPRMIYGNK